MFTLRCTQKILDRLKLSRPEVSGPAIRPTTALGDWYVNTLNIGTERWVICVSSESLLSVVMPARELRQMPVGLIQRVGALLDYFGVSPETIEREKREMESMAYGVTLSRSVVGSMNDLGDLAWNWRNITDGEFALMKKMASVPFSPLNGRMPSDLAKELVSRSKGS